MVQRNRDRVTGHGTIDLWPSGLGPTSRWVARDVDGKKVGEVMLTEDGRDNYGEALALLGLRRPFQLDRVLAYAEAREDWDDQDPWGSGMLVLGRLVDAQSATTETIHDDSATAALARALFEGRFTYRALRRAIRIVDRYLDLPEVAARSY